VVDQVVVKGRPLTEDEIQAAAELYKLEPPYDLAQLQALINEANQESSGELEQLLLALLVLALLPSPRMIYSVQDARYFARQRPLSQVDLQRRLFAEGQQNATRMQRRTQRLLDERLSLADWERQMARDILRSNLRAAQAGAGTAGRLTPAHIEKLRAKVSAELEALRRLADDLSAGRISPKMALYRAGRYGRNATQAFWEAQHQTYSDGRWMARRFLDPTAEHCRQCPGYAQPNWLPVDQVVPKGAQCDCRGNCRCRVEYRPATLSDRLPIPQT